MDYNILGSILGSPYFGKLPFGTRECAIKFGKYAGRTKGFQQWKTEGKRAGKMKWTLGLCRGHKKGLYNIDAQKSAHIIRRSALGTL